MELKCSGDDPAKTQQYLCPHCFNQLAVPDLGWIMTS